ncbi:hypothetical protein [Salmonella enterica]
MQQLADPYGVTSERLRQLVMNAMKQLRSPTEE